MKQHFITKIIALCIAGLLCVTVSGQKILMAAADSKLYSLDVSNGSCVTQPVDLPCAGSQTGFFSIALYKDTLYYTSLGVLYRTVLNQPQTCTVLARNVFANSLTVDRNGILYWMTGSDLVTFNPQTGVTSITARVPFLAAGDLVFYKDKLLLASTAGIVEIDISAKPVTSKLILPTGRLFYGLFSLPVDCNNSRIYALEANSTSAVVELDLDNKAILGTYCTLPIEVYDAASITEAGINQGITVNSLNITPQCSTAEKGSIRISAISGTANVSLQYTLNSSVTNTDGKFPDLSAGNYAIRINSSNGCSLDTTAVLILADKVDGNFVLTADTCGAMKGSILAQPTSGTQPFSFSINNNTPQTSPFFGNLAAGSHTVKMEDKNGCLLTRSVTIASVSPPLPLSKIEITPASCNSGGSVTLSFLPSPVITGARINGGNFIPGNYFTDLAAGTYHLQLQSAGCIYDTVIVIPISTVAAPLIHFSTTSPDCYDRHTGSIRMTISNILQPFTVSMNGGTPSAATSYNGLAPGTYQFVVKDQAGCEWKTSSTVPPYVIAPTSIQQHITHAECFQSQPGRVTLQISGTGAPYFFEVEGKRYLSGQEVPRLLPGNYTTRIYASGNCLVDSTAFTINSQNSAGVNCDTIYVPSAFTPNADGNNDLAKPILNAGVQAFVFRIYNRVGQMVYETRSAGQGWNGKLNGLPQPPATYVWIMEYVNAAGQKRVSRGSIVLIR